VGGWVWDLPKCMGGGPSIFVLAFRVLAAPRPGGGWRPARRHPPPAPASDQRAWCLAGRGNCEGALFNQRSSLLSLM
jgi:hypothetical protein